MIDQGGMSGKRVDRGRSTFPVTSNSGGGRAPALLLLNGVDGDRTSPTLIGSLRLISYRVQRLLRRIMKTFRPWNPDQKWLLPPSVDELVPEGDPAHFVRDTVLELDLAEILDTYTEVRGYPPYDPRMMTALMGLFRQVLVLCQRAGLVKLGHVALDGTKMKANASKHKAMSYDRMAEKEERLKAEIEGWFEEAERVDAEEDRVYGADKRGDEVPDWVKNRQTRLAKIREARKALEAQARTEAEEKARKQGKSEKEAKKAGKKAKPEPKAQRNFTDPESRIMKGGDGFVQAYNCQAAVDDFNQVIVAADVTDQATDMHQLTPMVQAIEKNAGRQAQELSADAGYCSEENLAELNKQGVRGYVATGKDRHGDGGAKGKGGWRGPLRQEMSRRLRRGGFYSRYRKRKILAEPVFGQIKQARGFRQFLMRGLHNVAGEWSLVCTGHNLLKLFDWEARSA